MKKSMEIITIDRKKEVFMVGDQRKILDNSFTCDIQKEKLDYLMNKATLEEVMLFIREKIRENV